jgi:hypothetical protein
LEEILVRVEPAEDDEADEKWWIETIGKGNKVMISIATALGWFPDPSQLWLRFSFVADKNKYMYIPKWNTIRKFH